MKARIDALLKRLTVLRNACDLDLLVFFSRHPRSLITAEDLARLVGYDPQQIGRSLEALVASAVLVRLQNDVHAARMYVLDRSAPGGGWMSTLLEIACTREGRVAILESLKARQDAEAGDPRAHRTARPEPRKLAVARA